MIGRRDLRGLRDLGMAAAYRRAGRRAIRYEMRSALLRDP
jgi:hypothetical protein